nr:reverse transcriptase domain-containing protein [Tanacetum cinerariifolium]
MEILLEPTSNKLLRILRFELETLSRKFFELPDHRNAIANSKSDLKAITTQSGVSYDGPQIPPLVVENEPGATKDTVNPTNNGNTKDVQPQVVQSKSSVSTELAIAPVSASKPNPKASIPYLSKRNVERNREKANIQTKKFYQIFKDMSFEISFADALILMPKFASTLKALTGNKEKLSEMARTLLNEHCSAVLLKKLPKNLGDPGKFLIPCDFPSMTECLALADLDLANRSISRPIGVAEDVYIKVGSFHFQADFVVVDFDADPRVPLILKRSFLKTERALIYVFEGELTLQFGKETITFNLDQTSRYSANYSDMTAKRIDVIDMACEEYSQEVLGFSDTILSGNPTPYHDPIVFSTSPTLTPFENTDFLLKEVDAFLAIEDEPTLSQFHQSYLDPKGDILLLEAFLNDDPSSPPLNQRNYLPEVRKELKICEAKIDKSSVDEPLVVELKTLPPHLEYAFLEVQHQRRVNPKIYDVIKQVVIKLLDAGLIYPISDSPWVSSVHCVPKKGGFTVVENEDNELIPTRLVMGWRVCIDYGKLNEATQKEHLPLPFMDQMLERLARNRYYCFLDEKMLKRCEDTNLFLNLEKSHFMVKEGIVLGHKISKQGIEVDKAKVDVITKLPYQTTVMDWDMPFELMCDASDFAIGAVLGQRQDKHFKPIHYVSKTMTEVESNYTMAEKEMLAVVISGNVKSLVKGFYTQVFISSASIRES